MTSFLQGFLSKLCIYFSHIRYICCHSHPPWFDCSNIWQETKKLKFLIIKFTSAFFYFSDIHIFSSASCYKTPVVYNLPFMWEQDSHSNKMTGKMHFIRHYKENRRRCAWVEQTPWNSQKQPQDFNPRGDDQQGVK